MNKVQKNLLQNIFPTLFKASSIFKSANGSKVKHLETVPGGLRLGSVMEGGGIKAFQGFLVVQNGFF